MASPAVAASAALVRQYLKEQGVAEEALADMVNRLLMSTATPIVDEAHDTLYFVRRQGRGPGQPAAAVASQAYIQVEGTNKSKFELGDDPERTGVYTMDFEVVNFSDGGENIHPGHYGSGTKRQKAVRFGAARSPIWSMTMPGN